LAKLLIIDDNAVNLELMQYLLVAFGHEVTAIDNGKDALLALKRASFDLVLCDVQMPGMDGLQFLAALRERPELCQCPVIAVTALAMVGDRGKLLASGFDGYVSKPIDPARFGSEVQSFLDANRASGKGA
jgi:CheY-like chemotaxis protein